MVTFGTHYIGDRFALALYLLDSLYRSTQNIHFVVRSVLNFEKYRFEYASYWQGPYGIRIVSAAYPEICVNFKKICFFR